LGGLDHVFVQVGFEEAGFDEGALDIEGF